MALSHPFAGRSNIRVWRRRVLKRLRGFSWGRSRYPTIARDTLPLAIFDPETYGYRLGVLGADSARISRAFAPLVFS